MAGDLLHVADPILLWNTAPGLDDGPGDGVGRELLCQGGGFQQLLWSAVFGVDSGDSKGALSQSACLVQHHDSGIGQGLQIVAPLHQDTLLGRSAQPAKKGQGNGDDQGAWAGYDQEVQGTGDPHPPPASQQGGKQPQG